ncbi:methylamine utilization protein [Endozoicomonas sp. SM1973]|uniref:Methylamine utilization protein n=1 Tax=Spartinivicinus marinus TaxID=2994442 RepID=A0A853IAH0_9GAMM|nr:plastocyanin/azurin family copper-binding protein [Spartinivicinus marinus]MCX4026590.1 plastocyanin/azurin family copper-binding protein [Spartinivicinus marinus]NYZ64426.1 methylamine utilization protein [Spartinivicinus marinus]
MKVYKLTCFSIALIYPLLLVADVHIVDQKNKEFSTTELRVKVGDEIRFTNQDPFFHNIFSLSDTMFFDLGSYPQGEFRSIKVKQSGVIEVECAIHPSMNMKIIVEE